MSHNALPITFSTDPDTVGLLRHDSGAVSLSPARHRACLEAAWEIEALARRLGDLAGAVMSGLDDGVVVDHSIRCLTDMARRSA